MRSIGRCCGLGIVLALSLSAAILLTLSPSTKSASWSGRTASWHHLPRLEAALEQACHAVESITGWRFETRPLVALGSAGNLLLKLEREIALSSESNRLSVGDVQVRVERAKRVASYFDPQTNTIYLIPDAIDRVCSYRGIAVSVEQLILYILIHEATHAIDFEKFPSLSRRNRVRSVSERCALEAVIEGHAQWVTEKSAQRNGESRIFGTLVDLITWGTVDKAKLCASSRKQSAVLEFVYVDGHEFISYVHAHRGSHGVRRVLESPPTSPIVIAHPRCWLEPALMPEQLHSDVSIDAFLPLLEGESWHFVRAPVLSGHMHQSSGEKGEPGDAQAFRGGYSLIASLPGEQTRFIGSSLVFGESRGAKEFLDVYRSKACRSPDVSARLSVAIEGRADVLTLAGSSSTSSDWIDLMELLVRREQLVFSIALPRPVAMSRRHVRSLVDYLCEHMACILGESVQRPSSPIALPLQVDGKLLSIRVTGPDSVSPPLVDVVIRTVGKSEDEVQYKTCVCGQCEVRVTDLDAARVYAYRARTFLGDQLEIAPSLSGVSADDNGHAAVVLEKGRSVRGHVQELGNDAVSGAKVLARPRGVRGKKFGPRSSVSWAKTDLNGAFTLKGIDSGPWELIVVEDDKRVLHGPTAFSAESGSLELAIERK